MEVCGRVMADQIQLLPRGISFRISAHHGSGILSLVAYVQCVFTKNGLPPAKPPGGSGEIQRVRYEANYVFYSSQ